MCENTHKLRWVGIGLMAAMLAAAPVASADEAEKPVAEAPPAKTWDATVGFDAWTEYIFRGVDLSANQWMYNPSASVSFGGFSVWYWGAFSDVPGPGWYEENDYGIDYTLSLFEKKVSVTGGFQIFSYPDDSASGTDSYEFYGIVSGNVFLTPTLTAYYDFDEFQGAYVTLGISHSFDLSKAIGLDKPMAWSIDPSASLGIDFDYNDTDTDLNDILLGLSTTLQLTKSFEVHAGVQWSIALSNLRDIGQGNELIGNVGASFSF